MYNIRLILLLLKTYLKSTRYILLVICFTIFSFVTINDFQAKDNDYKANLQSVFFQNYTRNQSYFLNSNNKLYENQASLDKGIYDAFAANDIDQFYKLRLDSTISYIVNNEAKFQNDLDYLDNSYKVNNIKDSYDFNYYELPPMYNQATFTYLATICELYDTYMLNSDDLITQYSINSFTFFPQFLSNILQILLIIVLIALSFGIYTDDYNSGLLKIFFSSQMKKEKYLFLKSISITLSIIIAIFIPFILVQMYLMIINQSFDINTIIPIYRNGLFSFDNIAENYNKLFNIATEYTIDARAFSINFYELPVIVAGKTSLAVPYGIHSVNSGLVFLLLIPIIVLLSLVTTQISILFETITKNKIIGLIGLLGIFLLQYILSLILPKLSWFYAFNFMSLITGQTNSTYFAVIVNLVVRVFVVIFLNKIIINKKDIY